MLVTVGSVDAKGQALRRGRQHRNQEVELHHRRLVYSSPAVGRDGATVFVGSVDSKLHAVDMGAAPARTLAKAVTVKPARPPSQAPGAVISQPTTVMPLSYKLNGEVCSCALEESSKTHLHIGQHANFVSVYRILDNQPASQKYATVEYQARAHPPRLFQTKTINR